MTRATLLFVHGTGVRGEKYGASFQTLKSQIAKRGLQVDLKGCFWGESVGAGLHFGGRSIPEYDATHGGVEPSEDEVQLALWAVLYTDPWYELRTLYNYPGAPSPVFGQEPPAARLRSVISAFEPNATLAALLTQEGLEDYFAEVHGELVLSQEFQDATATAPDDPLVHRQAIARALVAGSLAASESDGNPPVSGDVRDAIVTAVGTQLQAYGLGLSSFLSRQLVGLASAWYVRPRRGKLTDQATDPTGDVLRFLARGDAARAYLSQAIDLCGEGPVVLLGHSLGGIMCVDLLVREDRPSVSHLVTIGSQAPFLYEIGALPSLDAGSALPEHFPEWLNIYDRKDLLSYIGAQVFDQRVTDRRVDNRQPFPQSHSAYWTNPEVWDAVAEVLP